ncbi:MAG: histidine kinase, partial [Hungatella sp.]
MQSTPKTFQRKIIFYNLLIVICIATAVSFYNYTSYRRDAVLTEIRNSTNRIQNLSDRLEVAYDEMVNILLNCTERKSLFLTTTFPNYLDGYQNAAASIYASDVLKDLCAISGYSDYIYKISLYNQGFLLQAGSSAGSSNDAEIIMETPWFPERLTQTSAQYDLTLVDNPFPFGKKANPKILPFLRPLPHGVLEDPADSWVLLAISPKLFDRTLSSMPTDSIIYAVTRQGETIASLNGELFDTDALIQQLLHSDSGSGSFQTTLGTERCVISYEKQPISGLLFFEVFPIDSMDLDHNVISNTILITFIFCILIGLVLSFLISKQLGAPIKRLTKRLQLISGGNFERDYMIETDDEVGMIGKQINQMTEHIATLLDDRVQDEKERKDMEIKMLQAQINPHFLYNTLDSIKWIATMQKNSGIVQVVTALSSLLKNMAKGFNEKVTLRQELDFLQNYVTIEKIRYIELFDVEIQ